MASARMPLEDLLLKQRAIDETKLRRAREEQTLFGGDLGQVLLELGFITEEVLVRARSEQLGIPAVQLDQHVIASEVVRSFPVHLCQKYGVVPVSVDLAAKQLLVATANPNDAEQLAALAHETGYRIEPAVATAASIERAIRRAYFDEEAPQAPERPRRAPTGPVQVVDPVQVPDAAEEDEMPAAAAAVEVFEAAEEEAKSEEVPEIEPEADELRDLADLRARIERLEKAARGPKLSALLTRLERLEQMAESDRRGLRALSRALIDLGVITDEELKKRLSKG
jgi:type IV pilus assembly protein PilB